MYIEEKSAIYGPLEKNILLNIRIIEIKCYDL